MYGSRLRPIAALLAVALLMGGCATVQKVQSGLAAAANFTVTQGQLDGAETGYAPVWVAMKTYSDLPRCPPGVKWTLQNQCHDPAILKSWRAVDKKVDKGFTDTQAAITSGNNKGAVAAWNLLQDALDSVKAVASASGMSIPGL